MSTAMIHQLLSLSRPLIVLDVETTGLNTQTARIIELGFQVWTAEGLAKEWCSLIDPGVPIPAETSKIHGITDASMQQCQTCKTLLTSHPIGRASEIIDAFCITPRACPSFVQIAPSLAKGFTGCDFAGKHVKFDLDMLKAEMDRVKQRWSYEGARIVDAERLEQLGEPRTLSALYQKHTGKRLEGTHQVLADVKATTEVIAAQLERYAVLPRDLDTLHAAQWPGFITLCGRFRMNDGVAVCSFGKRYNGVAVKDIDPGFWEWIISNTFPDDVKQLAREAKMGRFL